MKSLVLLLSFFAIANSVFAADSNSNLKKEFQNLGDNKDVIERVKKMDSHQKVRIVQNRLVNRNNRIELAGNFGSLFGADSYVKTSNLGLQLQYHINPNWSFGGEYSKAYNSLSSEGQRQYDLAYACQQQGPGCQQRFAGVDFPLETTMATISFYPIYGKLNLFDSGIAQFDIYTLIGYGQKKLNSGSTNTMAAGLGVGIWMNNYFTSRLELRYESYKDMLDLQSRNQSAVTAIASVGVLVW